MPVLSQSQAHERTTNVFIDAQPRTYTRDVWYASEHDDYDADALDEPLERARAGPTASFETVWGYDAYEESAYRPMVAENAETLAQVRADVASAPIASALERRRIRAAPAAATELPPPAPLRVRDEILASLGERTSRETLFSTDFAAAVPSNHRREFLASLEIDSLLAVLATHLYTVVAGGYVHSREPAIIRELSAVGARFQSAESLTLDAPPSLLPTDARALHRAHVHANRCRLRLLYFGTAVPKTPTDAMPPPAAAALGYRVRIVYQVVDDDTTNGAILCFCTFQFSR